MPKQIQKKVQCKYCPKLIAKSNISHHNKSCHFDEIQEKRDQQLCPVCSEYFHKRYIRTHIRKQHPQFGGYRIRQLEKVIHQINGNNTFHLKTVDGGYQQKVWLAKRPQKTGAKKNTPDFFEGSFLVSEILESQFLQNKIQKVKDKYDVLLGDDTDPKEEDHGNIFTLFSVKQTFYCGVCKEDIYDVSGNHFETPKHKRKLNEHNWKFGQILDIFKETRRDVIDRSSIVTTGRNRKTTFCQIEEESQEDESIDEN